MSRMQRIVTLAAFTFLHPTFAQNDKPLSTQQLIEQLGHKQFTQREKAYKLLQSLGSSALPELKKALNHPEEEVRTRAAKLIPLLETMAALEPTRVSLNVDQEPLSTVLYQIQKQTGYKVESKVKSDDKRYSFQRTKVTFWEAMEEIRKKSGESIVFQASPAPYMGWWTVEGRSRFVSNYGSFRMEVMSIQENRLLSFDEPSKDNPRVLSDHLLTLSLGIFTEPKYYLFSIREPIIESIADEQGNQFSMVSLPDHQRSQLSQSNDAIRRITNFIGGTGFLSSEITIKRSSEKVSKIKELKGRLPVRLIADRKDRIIAEKLAEGKGKKVTAWEGTDEIADIQQTPTGKVCLQLLLPFNARQCGWETRFRLIDSKGNPIEGICKGENPTNKDQIDFEYPTPNPAGDNSPIKLVFEEWIIVDYEVPFAFKDIPLP
jgi:hypothetical protein